LKAVHAVSRPFSVEKGPQSFLSSYNSNKTPATPPLRLLKRDIHNRNAAQKLDPQNRLELVLTAVRLGIIPHPCAAHAALQEAA
jgi:hypothetical protein